MSFHPIVIGGIATSKSNVLEERLVPELVHGADAERILIASENIPQRSVRRPRCGAAQVFSISKRNKFALPADLRSGRDEIRARRSAIQAVLSGSRLCDIANCGVVSDIKII
jgi:hypothetical protein